MKFHELQIRCALALAIGLAAIMLLVGCGGRSHQVAPSIQTASADSLDDALDELDALDTPEGVDAALFAQLKGALAEALITHSPGRRGAETPPYKITSTPPTGATNRIEDLACSLSDGEYVLSWLYRNSGDYDQNGVVGIEDITPLAMHFGEDTAPENEWIDGDSDGRVHISDITPIAMHFGANVHHYSVQGSHFFSSQFIEVAQLEFPESTPNDARLELAHSLGAEPEYLYWRIVPVDDEGNPGDASNTAQVSAAPPPAVRILSINPLGGVTGTEVTFNALVTGEAPFDYEWSFGGGATPNESTEASPTVTLGAVDVYDASLSVENADGSAVKHFTLTVTAEPGEPPQIISVSPTEGDSGTEATFAAEVTGDGPFTYYWDFGGGASPNFATDPNPTVTLSRGGTLPEPVAIYPASLTVVNPFGMSIHDFNLNISACWHVEQIPLVPGYDEIWTASYEFGPDAILWGTQVYMVGGEGTSYLVQVRNEDFDYEELSFGGELAIDRDGNPAFASNKGIAFLTFDLYFRYKENGVWEEERVDAAKYGAKPQLFFDSQNRPVIVYSRRLSSNSRDLWVAKRVSGEWELTEVRGEGPNMLFYAAIGADDRLRILYNPVLEEGFRYTEEGETGWNTLHMFKDEGEEITHVGGPIVVDAGLRTLALIRRYEDSVSVARLMVGVKENDLWQFEEVGAFDTARQEGVLSPVVTHNGLRVVSMYFYDTDTFIFYASEEPPWLEVQEFTWAVSGDPEMTLSPIGEPVLISKDEMVAYW